MPALLRAVALYGVASASLAARRFASRLCLYLGIGLLAAVGLAFLTLAAFLALAQPLGAVSSATIIGCTYLVVALLAVVVMRTAARR